MVTYELYSSHKKLFFNGKKNARNVQKLSSFVLRDIGSGATKGALKTQLSMSKFHHSIEIELDDLLQLHSDVS